MKKSLLVLAFMLSIGAFAQNLNGNLPIIPYCETVFNFKPTCPPVYHPVPPTYKITVCHDLVGSTLPAEYEQVLGDLVDNYICINGQWPSWVTIEEVKWPISQMMM